MLKYIFKIFGKSQIDIDQYNKMLVLENKDLKTLQKMVDIANKK